LLVVPARLPAQLSVLQLAATALDLPTSQNQEYTFYKQDLFSIKQDLFSINQDLFSVDD
jgi:hypothetical protein